MSLWVGLVIDLHQVIHIDMGVLLGGGEGRVAKEFLDGSKIDSPLQKVGCKGVAQGVRGDLFHGGYSEDVVVNYASHTPSG